MSSLMHCAGVPAATVMQEGGAHGLIRGTDEEYAGVPTSLRLMQNRLGRSAVCGSGHEWQMDTHRHCVEAATKCRSGYRRSRRACTKHNRFRASNSQRRLCHCPYKTHLLPALYLFT